MEVELDHVFLCTSVGGSEAARLVAFGLTEGAPNEHPGQGTANRRFFWRNAYLELLWIKEAAEALSAPIRPTRLWERWARRKSGACPFGIGLRPKSSDAGALPFSTWDYRPPYLPPPLRIRVATNSDVLTEPMLFHLEFAQRPDGYPAAQRQPLAHGVCLHEVTRLELVGPHVEKLSAELQAVADTSLVRLRFGAEELMDLGFDGEPQGSVEDFRPELPLRFHW